MINIFFCQFTTLYLLTAGNGSNLNLSRNLENLVKTRWIMLDLPTAPLPTITTCKCKKFWMVCSTLAVWNSNLFLWYLAGSIKGLNFKLGIQSKILSKVPILRSGLINVISYFFIFSIFYVIEKIIQSL